jgi:protoporphyrinogen oxidase
VNDPSADQHPVLIVGGGMAGLACAMTLQQAGVPFLLFEQDEKVGGRVQTDEFDGYRLDRGFQVLLTAYPEARKFLDYEKLELRKCYPGSRVWYKDKFHQVSDPFRHPLDGVCSVFNPIGSFWDKVKVGMLRLGLLSTRAMEDTLSTTEALAELGYSEAMIDRFWKPFMRGVFLENELSTSVRKFEETFSLFAKGDTVLPRLGIGEIPKQMAKRLPEDSIFLKQEVKKVGECSLVTSDGKEWQGRAVVLATEEPVANRLLRLKQPNREWNSVDCLYFSLPEKELPCTSPILHLDGSGTGPINNLTFISTLSDCAPTGRALASASVIGKKEMGIDQVVELANQQLSSWFGERAKKWDFLRAYRIRHAVPNCDCVPDLETKKNGVYRCGDYLGLPSIDSAMRSGRLVAESIIASNQG